MSDFREGIEARIAHILALDNANGISNAELLENLKLLRNACAGGSEQQLLIVNNTKFNNYLHTLLFERDYEKDTAEGKVQQMAWQLLANSIVGNTETQRLLWQQYGPQIKQQCLEGPLERYINIKLMILYNIYIGSTGMLKPREALDVLLNVWDKVHSEKYDKPIDYLHLFFEKFLIDNGRQTVSCYAALEPSHRITFLDYAATYLREDDSQNAVHAFLLQYICKEFKMKSDSILRTASNESAHKTDDSRAVGSELHPRETVALLRVIACASGSEKYASVFGPDQSLFLNVSSLLRFLVAYAKETNANSMHKPLNKLEEVALTSGISREYESEVSYELKTLLVRTVANLLYKNPKNKEYCLDTDLMPALFECTNMDARNPLIKEWSILAIRNACDGCLEIQQLIANLSNQGPAQNDILSELNLQLGSLRIQPNRE